MPTSCSALRCTNRQKKGSGITFHSFPHDRDRRQKWISAVGRFNWTPSVHASLCSVHFEEKCFDRTGQTVRLKDGSVPTVFRSPLTGRLRKINKPPENFMELNIKQETEAIDKAGLTKRKSFVLEENISYVQECDKDDHTYPRKKCLYGSQLDDCEAGKEPVHCFVCDKLVKDGVLLHCLTDNTKVKMCHKLDKIIASRIEIIMNEDEILCSRCARLLNYIDYVEVKLTMLTASVFSSLYGRHILGLHYNELLSMLPDLNDNIDEELSVIDDDRDHQHWTTGFPSHQKVQEHGDMADKMKENQFQCQACNFTTNYKSVMIYHLRQHLKTSFHCDFCVDLLPDYAKCSKSGQVSSFSAAKSETYANTDLSEVAEVNIETLDEEVSQSQDASYSAEYFKDIDRKEKVLNYVSESKKESDIKFKHPPVDLMNVENMLEELHQTGQISAFSNSTNNNNNNNQCKVKNASKCETDVSSSCKYSMEKDTFIKSTFIKSELMNIDESEVVDEVESAAENVLCQNQIFQLSTRVKSEVQNNLFQEPVTPLTDNSESVEGQIESTSIAANQDTRCERRVTTSMDMVSCGSDVKHLIPTEEIAR